MKTLALALLLAVPALADAPPQAGAPLAAGTSEQPLTPVLGPLESSKVRLDAGDAAGALTDAQTALAHDGGADAYAARADAERALGHPFAEVLADYASAAKLDPRYMAKHDGLIAQQNSEENPQTKQTGSGGLGGVPIAGILATASIGALCLGIAVVMLKARGDNIVAPDDEAIKAGGRADGSDEPPPKA